ncbi:MAG: amino acid-binding ACT domain protein [Candidatus Diapherotrites archaeon]|nr:amino acid-binding ACT domain protein [Candidatus Diapherotrites archaeon]
MLMRKSVYSKIWSEFVRSPAREKVAREFLKLGISVSRDKKIRIGNIEQAPAKIGKALGVDRRVVLETVHQISSNETLLLIFSRLESRAFLGKAGKELGLDVIEIHADASLRGVLAGVSTILFHDGMNVRQAIVDDPDLFHNPVLTIVLDGKLKQATFKKLQEFPLTERAIVK